MPNLQTPFFSAHLISKISSQTRMFWSISQVTFPLFKIQDPECAAKQNYLHWFKLLRKSKAQPHNFFQDWEQWKECITDKSSTAFFYRLVKKGHFLDEKTLKTKIAVLFTSQTVNISCNQVQEKKKWYLVKKFYRYKKIFSYAKNCGMSANQKNRPCIRPQICQKGPLYRWINIKSQTAALFTSQIFNITMRHIINTT